MKIKNCILVNGNHSISVNCSHSKGTASFKYYGIKPLPGHFPDGDEINTDIQDGQLIYEQHLKEGIEVAF